MVPGNISDTGGYTVKKKVVGFLLLLITAGCTGISPSQPTIAPTLPLRPTLTPTPVIPRVWISDAVPMGLRNSIKIEGAFEFALSKEEADVLVVPTGEGAAASRWIYTLVAPFNTVVDGITLEELKLAWQGQAVKAFPDKTILLSAETLAAFESAWGEAADNGIRVLDPEEITDALWQENGWGLIPFEDLNPRLKVLDLDGRNPLMTGFLPAEYPLRVDFQVRNNNRGEGINQDLGGFIVLPSENFDPALMTSVLMTGTTALVRSTAERMNTKGIDYPGLMIGSILRDADFTHISNEASFTPVCPDPDPWLINLQFCSDPDHFPLIEQMGVDIIELTGNHLLDYNPDAFKYSYDLYKQDGFKTFGGGLTLQQAREPLIIEHNGNRLAFIGCNPVGPDFVWAGDQYPGAAICDFEELHEKIIAMREEGILVIATLQGQENYEAMPLAEVRDQLDGLSDAGAVVVSGSQSHFPQGFSFRDSGLVHYGLGNLFFDQMDYPVVGTRREFYDKHFFYNGKYINTRLLTGMLEDYAQPRPMTLDERVQFLSEIFAASGWQ